MIEETSRTAAATRTRMRASEEKMARKLHERGWLSFLTGIENLPTDPDAVVYATNPMRETCRVVDWTMEGKPILATGDGKTHVGTLDYVFSVGPK